MSVLTGRNLEECKAFFPQGQNKLSVIMRYLLVSVLCGVLPLLVFIFFCPQVRNLKERGMDFLVIPDTYYDNLRTRLKDAPITVKEDLTVVSYLGREKFSEIIIILKRPFLNQNAGVLTLCSFSLT